MNCEYLHPGVPEIRDVDSFGIVKGDVTRPVELAGAGAVLTPTA